MNRSHLRGAPLRRVLVPLLLLLALPAAAAAQEVCVRTVSAAPTIDGVVANALPSGGCVPDAIWAGVAPGEYQPGGSLPQAHLFLAFHSASSTLAVGVAVHGDEDLSNQDYVSLFFDRDNSDSFNNGDFVIRVQATSSALINSGILCNQTTGTVTYFSHNGTGWVSQAPPGAITARLAYDFDTGADPDDKLWNLELSFNAATFGVQTASPFFGIGSFLFVDDGHQSAPQVGTVRKWPGTIALSPTITQIDPAFAAPNPAELANASLAGTCFDVNFTAANPWKINNAAAAATDHRIVRNAVNTFTVTFFFDGPGAAPTPMPNNGTVRLKLKPYGAFTENASQEWELPVQAVNAATANQAHSVTFTANLASPPANWSGLGTIDFICATMYVETFQRDDNTTNNSLNVNYNYFTTSEYLQPVFISADGVPGLSAGQSASILLRVVAGNEGAGAGATAAAAPAPGPGLGGRERLLLGGAGAAVLLLAAAFGRRGGARRRVAAGAGLLLLLGTVACPGDRGGGGGDENGGGTVRQDSARFTFANADSIGLKPVAGQPGWYTIDIPYGEVRRLDLRFRAMPLPYKPRRVRLEPVRDGQPNRVSVDVRPGQVLALVATGAVDVDGPNGRQAPNSANGFVSGDARGRYLMRAGYYRPSDYAGALIGSFDNFETSFPVGQSTAMIVPAGASSLSLAVNANLQQVGVLTGAFDLDLVEPPPLQVPTYPTVQGDGTTQAPFRLDLWNALTSVNVYTFYQTEDRDAAGRVVSLTRHPLGFAHQVVYDVHQDGAAEGGRRR